MLAMFEFESTVFFATRGIQSNERKGHVLTFFASGVCWWPIARCSPFDHLSTFPLLQFLWKKNKIDAAVYFRKQVGNPSFEFKGLKCCSECDMTYIILSIPTRPQHGMIINVLSTPGLQNDKTWWNTTCCHNTNGWLTTFGRYAQLHPSHTFVGFCHIDRWLKI